jgi:hypothetical protein
MIYGTMMHGREVRKKKCGVGLRGYESDIISLTRPKFSMNTI